MTVIMLAEAEEDLDSAFAYYEKQRAGLGDHFLHEFRVAVDWIIKHPNAWQKLDATFRRRRIDRFRYGIIYFVDEANSQIQIVTVMQLNQKPDNWRGRLR